jgi:hypothetical protein
MGVRNRLLTVEPLPYPAGEGTGEIELEMCAMKKTGRGRP